MLSERKLLLEALQIKESFDVHKLLSVFSKMKESLNSQQVSSDYIELCNNIIFELNSITLNDEDKESFKQSAVILVDQNYILQSAKNLLYNDAPWLPATATDGCQFVHEKLSRSVALALGVIPTKTKYLDKFTSTSRNFQGVSFGQREELTDRIKNILRDYPLDVTLLKEFIQNADDAKATKMCVILDKRSHDTERVLSEEWKELQGPALLVWNDKDFTNKDIEGIQKLGVGSKGDDDESIGQFGIGFNVVYHITDCPSFITRGNILCVFDPHCRYVPGADPQCPGRQYSINEMFWNDMSGLSSAYLQSNIQLPPLQLSKGSLFRFPLRTDSFSSGISNEYHSLKEMEDNLNKWTAEIKDALLFLNNIYQFDYYIIEEDQFKLKNTYQVNLDENDQLQRGSLSNEIKVRKKPFIKTYSLTISTNNSQHKEKWLIQQGIGDMDDTSQDWLNKTIPKHGIASPIDTSDSFTGKVFCFLPLPVNSNLPVHINGQFILRSDRRSLWKSDSDDDAKANWNYCIIKAISSSYARFLENARNYFFESQTYTREQFDSQVKKYYNIFPLLRKESSSKPLEKEWLGLAIDVLEKLWSMNSPILVSEEVSTDGKTLVAAWYNLHANDICQQAYFIKHSMKEDVLHILKEFGMIFTCAPYTLYKSFNKHSDHGSQIAIANPTSVFSFYTNSVSMSRNYPCLIESTCFETVDSFKTFLEYLLDGNDEFPSSPINYPLLLTADAHLKYFKNDTVVIRSNSCSVFPKSLQNFMHPKLFDLHMSETYYSSSTLEIVEKFFNENFSADLKQPIAKNDLDDSTLTLLWTCITDDPYFSCWQKNIVESWALLPAKNCQLLYKSSSSIVPVLEPNNCEEEIINKTFKVLQYHDVPILNTNIHASTTKYCPSMNEYDRILSVVYHFQIQHCVFSKVTPSQNFIETLLVYFARSSFHYDTKVCEQLLSLPLFEDIGGKLTSLHGKKVYILPSNDFCQAGYEKWGSPCNNVVILMKNGLWLSLTHDYKFIGKCMSETDMYIDLIFPAFNSLNCSERKDHLLFIRDNMFQEKSLKYNESFTESLNNLEFMQSPINAYQLLPISAFSDHTVEIFHVFPDHFFFLDMEYRDEEWTKFFQYHGLCAKIETNQFINFCNLVAQGKHGNALKASDILLRYLFSSKGNNIRKSSDALQKIGNIHFVHTAELSMLSWIKEPHFIGLTKLKGSVLLDQASLIWTVKPVVCLPPHSSFKNKQEVVKSFGITEPDVKTVYDNLINISQSDLANFQLFNKYNPNYTVHNKAGTSILEVIINNMRFLMENGGVDKLESLSLVKCIPVNANVDEKHDLTNPVLVNSLQVVQVGTSEFSPYINIMPCRLIEIKECIDLIGVSQTVDLKHFQHMLQVLWQHTTQNPNDVSLVCKAITKLVELMKSYDDKDKRKEAGTILKPLYLPSVNQLLVNSTSLCFIDNHYSTIVKSFDFSCTPYSLFSIPAQSTIRKKYNEKEVCHALPEEVRPVGLSLISKEQIVDGFSTSSRPSTLENHFQKLKQLFVQPACAESLIKIAIKDFSLTNDNAELFITTLVLLMKDIELETIENLTSNIVVESVVIGRLKVEYLLQKMDGVYKLFLDENTTGIGTSLLESIARTVCIEIAQINELDQILFIDCLELVKEVLTIQNPEEFNNLLKRHNLDEELDVVLTEASQPILGQPISSQWIPYLNSDVNNIFRPQEWIGYEITNDNFIWGILLYPLEEESNNLLMKKYVIQTSDSTEITVSILDLYKIADHDECLFDISEDLTVVKREICNKLKVVWNLPDDEKKKALKRMYLCYHPDKAENSKALLYEEAFKFMKQQIERLSNGLALNDPDVPVVYTSTSESFQWTNFYENCKVSANKRNRSRKTQNRANQHQQSTCSTGSSAFSFQPNANINEAERWIRQAESDLSAMLKLYSVVDSSSQIPNDTCNMSQVIFLSHQVMEKSLKAGMYGLIGLNDIYLTNHSLNVHAISLGCQDSSLHPLKDLVKNMEHYYLDTRYPNRHVIPLSPVDVYTNTDSVVVDNAKEVFKLIHCVLNNLI